MAFVKWDDIDGVPVHYARHLTPSLRNPGERRSFESTGDFKQKLDAMFAELWQHCGLGRADIIVTAGALVDKPGKHGVGEAFDLDGIVWHARDSRPRRNFWSIDFGSDARFYWGLNGLLNRHLRYVLHAEYDTGHHDHIHIDDSESLRFRSDSRSAATYVQAAVTHVHGLPVVIDGDYGDQSRTAVRTALDRLGIAGSIDDSTVYAEFNLATARLGMDAGDVPVPDPAPVAEPSEQPVVELRLTDPRMEGEKVRELQQALLDARFDPQGVDGRFGPDTDRAVRDFQQDRGLHVDGIVGPRTAAALDGFSLDPTAPAEPADA